MVDVERHEVLLNDVRYPIIGDIEERLVSVFPPKTVTGDFTRDTEQIASSWIMGNFLGGILIKYMDATKHQDRAWFSTVDTRWERQVTLLPKATNTGNAGDAGSDLTSGAVYNNELYVSFNDEIRRWNEASQTWTSPTATDLLGNGSDALVIRLSTTNWLLFADGQGVMRHNGSTWTYQTGDGTNYPTAKYLCEWDQKVWAIDTNNQLWWTADPSSTWTKIAGAIVPEASGEVQGLKVFFNPANEASLHAPTKSGLWVYDENNTVWYRTRLAWPRHPTGAKGSVEYRGDFYISAGMSIYSYSGQTVRPIGLDRDNGIDPAFRGDISFLADGFSWLLAGVNATQDTGSGIPLTYGGEADGFAGTQTAEGMGFSSIYLWTGSAWHTLWISPSVGTGISWMQFNTANDRPRLWFGANGAAWYIAFPRGLFNPKEAVEQQYESSGYLITPWFDANWAEQDKIIIQIDFGGKDMTATETITVDYGTNDSDSWTTIATFTANEPDPVLFNVGAGYDLKNVRFRYRFARGSDATKSPILRFCTLKFVRWLEDRYSYVFTIDASQSWDNKTPAELRAALRTARASKRLLEMKTRRDNEELVSRKVLITRIGNMVRAGTDTSARYQIAVVEV